MLIVVGLIALFVIIFLFLAKDIIIKEVIKVTSTERYVRVQYDFLNGEIEKCMDTETTKALNLIGKQGGYIEPVHYLDYYGDKITYLCKNIPDSKKCANVMFTQQELENKLAEYIKNKVINCINFDLYESEEYTLNYDLTKYDLKVNINEANVLTEVYLPFSITVNELELKKDEFKKGINIPLGKILEGVKDLLNSEAVAGEADPFAYSIGHMEEKFFVQKRIRGNDKVYAVSVLPSDYEFQFAVEGGG